MNYNEKNSFLEAFGQKFIIAIKDQIN